MNPFVELKEKLKRKYEEQLRALELAEQLWNENSDPQDVGGGGCAVAHDDTMCQIDAAKEVARSMKGKFTYKDIENGLLKRGFSPTRNSLSGILYQLGKENVIKTVEKGRGRRASVYMVTKDDEVQL